MSINLAKTEKKGINLSKTAPDMKNVKALLWWKLPKSSPAYDLDVSAFCLKSTDSGPKLVGDEYLVFYNNEQTPEKSVIKTPDVRDAGQEEILIKINELESSIEEISLVVTIHNATALNQSFGQIQEAGIKIINDDTGEELAFYDLDENFKNETAVQVGSFYRQGDGFKFQAVGAGFVGLGLGDFVAGYQ